MNEAPGWNETSHPSKVTVVTHRLCNRILTIWLTSFALLCLSCSDEEATQNNIPVPPGFDGQDGSACVTNGDCDGRACLTRSSGYPGGYCTTLTCNGDDDCNNDDGVCMAGVVEGNPACLLQCERTADCRSRYECLEIRGTKVCLPSINDGPPAGQFGARCDAEDDCDAGLECELGVEDGYCLSRDCEACSSGSICAELPGVTDEACVQRCTDTTDCRLGLSCQESSGTLVCLPSASDPPTVPFEVTEEILDISCNAREVGMGNDGIRYQIDFDIPEEAEGFLVVPIVGRGQLSPVAILGPNGINIDLIDGYRHHNLRATELSLYESRPIGTYATVSFDWAIQVPYAPQFSDLVVPGGRYTMNLSTDTEPPCLYVLEASQGATLDLNFYFVGLEGLTPETAPDDADFAEVLARFDEIYEAAGISLGEIRYFDVPDEIVERYTQVRALEDIKRLTAFGQSPADSLDGHLSVDVFLVEDIVIGAGSATLLGISASIPGPPGMHGNAGNGLVFGIGDLGFDNRFVAHIMAHEIGHYLGLRHTTEVVHGIGGENEANFDALVGDTDPIEDTPVCESIVREGRSCPDAENLMFPAAPDDGDQFFPTLSEGQTEALRLNPAVK